MKLAFSSISLVIASLACATQRSTLSAARESPELRNGVHGTAVTSSTRTITASTRPKMRVHFIDVGQGAATLFEFPHDAVLVDTGGENNGLFDGTAALQAYLTSFFARRDDLHGVLTSLILTHPHIDHTRGVQTVLDHWPPQNVVTNGMISGSGGAQQNLAQQYAAAHESGAHPVGFRAVRLAQLPAAGLHDPVIDPVGGSDIDPVLTVLWGQVGSVPAWGSDHGKPRSSDPNNNSVVLRVDFGQASVLVTGDLEEVAIEDLLTRYAGTALLDVDVYECGHHGSINGTTASFVAAMSPDYAVACVGSPEREVDWTAWDYGHPRREVVDMLTAAIATPRPAIDVRVGRKGHLFDDQSVDRAFYATGWDGTVVLEAGADGVFRVIQPAGASSLVNINSAGADELEALPGIGPSKAQAIVSDRGAHGTFTSIDDLDRVPGIGPATINTVRPFVTVGP